MGQFEAYDRGGETAAVVDSQGNLKEGPGFNIFIVKDSVLTTPASGVLKEITRETAIELATEHGYKVVQSDMDPDNTRSADEAFATSTAGGIMPITKWKNMSDSSTIFIVIAAFMIVGWCWDRKSEKTVRRDLSESILYFSFCFGALYSNQ